MAIVKKSVWAAGFLLAIKASAFNYLSNVAEADDVGSSDASVTDVRYVSSVGPSKKQIRRSWSKDSSRQSFYRDSQSRTPAMMGDFFGGTPLGFRGDSVLDRLMVVADELDAPFVLPPGGSTLTISEPGPVGIFSTSVMSATQLQSIFRAGGAVPPATLVGIINDDATLTTLNTISQIQTQLAGTALPFDVILLQQPPGTYTTGINALFQTRNAIQGTTTFDAASSGAIIQGGVDTLNGSEDLDAFYFYDYIVRFNTAMADATSGGVGRVKIADGGAILPTNRIFCRYSNINNVAYSNGGRSLNRFVPGLEKTFFQGLTSLEVRAPFATDATTTSSLNTNSFTNGSDTRFGNLTLYAKGLLYQTDSLACSGGLGLALPTASDIRVNYVNGTSLLQIQNESVHIQPFLGMLYTPSSKIFAQGFLQYDATASGNSVSINSTGAGLQNAGTLTDANQIFFDASLGYWLYRTNEKRGLTGIVPTVEIHQTSSTQEGDLVAAGPFQVGNFSGSTSITSMVAGTTLEFGSRTQFTAGYATPLGGGSDRQYDGAFQFFFNRLLGP